MARDFGVENIVLALIIRRAGGRVVLPLNEIVAFDSERYELISYSDANQARVLEVRRKRRTVPGVVVSSSHQRFSAPWNQV